MTTARDSFFSLGSRRFLAVVAGMVGFLLYANTIPNFYNLDDELITANHVLADESVRGFKKIFTEPYYKDDVGNQYEYRPVVLVTYFFEYKLFGRNPHISHFFNVVLYSVTCAALFYLLTSLFSGYSLPATLPVMKPTDTQKSRWTRLREVSPGVAMAAFVTLLFIVHPLHTEVVASIKNRDELLALLFALLSWHCALQFADTRKAFLFFMYVAFFILALFSKQTSITFAILIPASIIFFRKVSVIMLLSLLLPVVLLATLFSPIYLIYKKVLLFLFQIAALLIFYYFISEREALARFAKNTLHKAAAFLSGLAALTGKYFRSFSFSLTEGVFYFKAKFSVLLGTVLILVLVAGIVSFLSKKESVEQASWNVKDALHDFKELQVVPVLKTPAPSVVPAAGRRLNYVELPLSYEDDFLVKLSTSFNVMDRYIRLMFAPFQLKYYYGFSVLYPTRFDNYQTWLSVFLHLAIFSVTAYLLFVRKHAIAAFGLVFYIVSLVPLSNLLTPVAGVVAERLAYPLSFGFCIVAGYCMLHFIVKWSGASPGRAKAAAIFFGVVCVLFAGATINRNFYWKDHLTLMRHDIKYLGNSARANHLYASHLAVKATESKRPELPENRKLLQESLEYFRRTLEIYPEFPNVWYEIAKVHLLLGDKQGAINAYYEATKANETFAPPSFELGIALEQAGRTKEAEEAYKQAIQRDSLFKEAYINLSYLYYKQGRYNESVDVHNAAIKQLPDVYELYLNLGRTYLMLHDVPNALSNMERAVAINRSDKSLLNSMSQLFESIGNAEKAAYYRNLQ